MLQIAKSPVQNSPTTPTSERRRPGRPRLHPICELPHGALRTAFGMMLEIRARRDEPGWCYPVFPFGSVPIAQGIDADREVTAHEMVWRLRQIEKFFGRPAERILAEWDQLVPRELEIIQKIIMRIGRMEKQRSLAGTRTWRRLDGELFHLVREAEKRGERFAATLPPKVLGAHIGVGYRAFQQALRRLRQERAMEPGYRVHVDLWLGPEPEGTPTSAIRKARLWVSRWRFDLQKDGIDKEAVGRGLLLANTAAEAKSARMELRRRWRVEEYARLVASNASFIKTTSYSAHGRTTKQPFHSF